MTTNERLRSPCFGRFRESSLLESIRRSNKGYEWDVPDELDNDPKRWELIFYPTNVYPLIGWNPWANPMLPTGKVTFAKPSIIFRLTILPCWGTSIILSTTHFVRIRPSHSYKSPMQTSIFLVSIVPPILPLLFAGSKLAVYCRPRAEMQYMVGTLILSVGVTESMSIDKNDDDQGAMTKSELIARLASKNPHLTHKDMERIVDVIFDEIASALSRGDRVELRGFGSFTVKHREPRQGRNPRTGESVAVAGKSIPFFKTGKDLRLRLNGKTSNKDS